MKKQLNNKKRAQNTSNRLSSKLKEIRQSQGLTIVELAKLAKVDRKNLARIDNKEKIGNVQTHLKLIKALGVSADEYFDLGDTQQISPDAKPEIVTGSNKGFQVEILPSHFGSVRRIIINTNSKFLLDNYTNPKSPVFCYIIDGSFEISKNKENYEVKPNDTLCFPECHKISIHKTSNLPGIIVAHQP